MAQHRCGDPSESDRLQHRTDHLDYLTADDQPSDVQRWPQHDQDRRPDGADPHRDRLRRRRGGQPGRDRSGRRRTTYSPCSPATLGSPLPTYAGWLMIYASRLSNEAHVECCRRTNEFRNLECWARYRARRREPLPTPKQHRHVRQMHLAHDRRAQTHFTCSCEAIVYALVAALLTEDLVEGVRVSNIQLWSCSPPVPRGLSRLCCGPVQ